MASQVLARSAGRVHQEIKQIGSTEKIVDEQLSGVNSTVLIIRWASILFCLVCWYGVYTAVRLLLS